MNLGYLELNVTSHAQLNLALLNFLFSRLSYYSRHFKALLPLRFCSFKLEV